MYSLFEQLSYPSEIKDYLFLSSVDSLENHRFLTKKKITHVISVMENPPRLQDNFPDIQQLVIPIPDSKDIDLTVYFESVFLFVKDTEPHQKRILIHCEKGISRSASFVIACLMYERHCQGTIVNYETTLLSVIKERAIVAPNPGFAQQLKRLAHDLNEQLSSLQRQPLTTQYLIEQFLTPRELCQLSGTNRFFYDQISFRINDIWKKHLSRDFPIVAKDLQFFCDNEISLKNIYLACNYFKKVGLPKITLPYLLGYLGNAELALSVLQGEEALLQLLAGAVHGFQLGVIKLHLSESASIKAVQTLLEHATAANNLPLLNYLDGKFSQISWNFVNANGNNLLHTAAHYGSYEVFVFLVETKQLDPYQLNNANSNLLASLSYSRNPRLIEYIHMHLSSLNPLHANNANITPYQIAEKNNNQIILEAYNSWPAALCLKM
ncbi:dual specificity protein phosphatase family protein [Legionella maioricensis]|uniref:Dual specificity protein phosphatase family protein n=1 Tax=Legionella maioricensis TaxID=2896528 RepID=A0A9X2I9K3_9GAMM|nr:dual specificity protein phosphatase family protein [Legionella maioricensis]MCL9683389.1 dual specificity protein phosphatase family protein [Legionella maioricensis]MCL9685915.1 dual specificity protein phosphatase family protein [Legionella maioricensis]